MIELPVIEDERGVDISQIRRQLRMTVPERIASMVAWANTIRRIQSTVADHRASADH